MSAGNNSTKEFINSFGGVRGARRASTASSDAASPPSSPVKFANLYNQKRNSADAGHAARKQSWSEQQAPKGIVGSWWDNMMKGNK